MRKFLFLFFILLTVVSVSEVSGANKEKKKKEKVAEEVMLFSEKVPQFKKGDFSKWVVSNLSYPQNALRTGQEGRTLVSFVVGQKGDVRDVKVARSSGHASLDQEAVRVISMSPKWIPGKTKGKVVAVRMNVPVNFSVRR